MASQSSCAKQECTSNLDDTTVAKRGGVLSTVLCRISQFWPISFTMRAFRGLWWLLGFSSSPEKALSPSPEGNSPPARRCRAVRKRLCRATRLLLAILPRRVQSAMGYPVCTSIGCSVSPEVSCSPNKPSGKGSKRKQDDIDAEEDELEQQSWVEALAHELAEEGHTADPDYEQPTSGDTDSEEYCTHNDTESDLEVEQGLVVIKDLDAESPPEAV